MPAASPATKPRGMAGTLASLGSALATPAGAAIGQSPAPLPDEPPADGALLRIDLDDIEPDPDQPRKAFSDRAQLDLINDLKRHGVRQALLVKPSGLQHPHKPWRIVDGERRWRAARVAVGFGQEHLRLLPCMVSRETDEENALAQLTTNLFREDLTVLEECRHLHRIHRDYGLNATEIAGRLNATGRDNGSRTPEWVMQRLAIAERLSSEAEEFLVGWDKAGVGDPDAPDGPTSGGPTFTLLRAISQVPVDRQLEILREAREESLTSRQVEQRVAALLEASSERTAATRRGRQRQRRFTLRDAKDLCLPVDVQPLTVHAGGVAHELTRVQADVRESNLMRLMRWVDRRGGKVDAESFLADAEAALAADREALASALPTGVTLDQPAPTPTGAGGGTEDSPSDDPRTWPAARRLETAVRTVGLSTPL